jgi:hypothetical protein
MGIQGALLQHDEYTTAAAIVEATLKAQGMSKAQLREALQSGLSAALYDGHPTTWRRPDTPREARVHATARLLLRLARELALPLTGVAGASAVGVTEELLAQ